ncbi:7953_t:CDS:2, partial [Gigaspora margarita]
YTSKILNPIPQINSEAGSSTQSNKKNTNIIQKFHIRRYIEGGLSTYYPIPLGDIIFEEAIVGDPDRHI